jgi:luciferase family oxidoreductase group 1
MTSTQKISFGVLDFGYRAKNINSLSIIEDVIEYASSADELGFSRFWISEHHDPNALLAWSNPQPMIPILAGITKNIRIGAAGVLIGIHNPYHVATQFKLLSNLFPERIDLGVARSVVNPFAIQCVEQREDVDNNTMLETIPEKIKNLFHYLVDEDEIFRDGTGVVIPPYKGAIPDLWMLGSSYNSLDKALELGANFSRSIFHPGSDKEARLDELSIFKEKYFEKHRRFPKINLSISGFCSKTTQKAMKIMTAQNMKPERHTIGCPNKFFDDISKQHEMFGIDEIILMNPSHNLQDRIESLQFISELFHLN